MTKYKRSSVVIFVVALILGISAVLLSYTGILYLILDVKTESGAAVNTRRPSPLGRWHLVLLLPYAVCCTLCVLCCAFELLSDPVGFVCAPYGQNTPTRMR